MSPGPWRVDNGLVPDAHATHRPASRGRTRAYLAKEFSARKGLVGLGVFFAYGLFMSILYATMRVGLPCPMRSLTGWDCPLCGGTRMGVALLHGDVPAALSYNPVVLIGLVVLTVLGVLWTVEVLGGPKIRPPAALGQRLRRVHPTQWTALALVFGIIYTLMRNLL